MTLLEKADIFWEWFLEQEPRLLQILEHPTEYNPDQITELLDQGISLLSPDLRYTFGGKRQFTFSIGGQEHLFYLLPYIVSRRPMALSGWDFYPGIPGMPGQTFQFSMFGASVPCDQVLLSMSYHPVNRAFQLEFYHPALCALEPTQSLQAFYAMLELSIGESLSWLYIDRAEPLQSPGPNMFPLSQLDGKLREALRSMDLTVAERPEDRRLRYGFDARKSIFRRFDIIEGFTSYTGLLNDYYSGRTEQFEALLGYGAKACYLSFPRDRSLSGAQTARLRYQMENALQQALGPTGSGLETGVVLGGALGRERCYIDLLLYHEPAFLPLARQVLAGYPYSFSLSDFCLLAPPLPLYSKGPLLN